MSEDIHASEFGMYIHIPYCLQKCHYCDFVKFQVNELPPLDDYLKLLFQELKLKRVSDSKKIRSLYLGGGTPSLLSLKQMELLLNEIRQTYSFDGNIEISLEINPGTLSKNDFKELTQLGVNRFSLGVQTFNPLFLKACGRMHSPADSLNDLEMMNELNINFSTDILFGLPNQTEKNLLEDLDTLLKFSPPHVSPYNLTLPEKHFFNAERPPDEIQVKMMALITEKLQEHAVLRYEISNYAQAGKESQHNRSYWEDVEYLGLGMGAHSYFKDSEWGTRTWNTGVYSKYAACIEDMERPHQQKEVLKLNEALTDFCHTFLRQRKGFNKEQIILKFGQSNLPSRLWQSLSSLEHKGLISYNNNHWALTSTGLELPNEVFRELCFLEEDFL